MIWGEGRKVYTYIWAVEILKNPHMLCGIEHPAAAFGYSYPILPFIQFALYERLFDGHFLRFRVDSSFFTTYKSTVLEFLGIQILHETKEP